MRALLFALLGAVVGLVLGVVIPVGLSEFYAWRADYAPGSGAGTAFSVLMILTAPGGALAGFIAGFCYGHYE